jgi:hypothetical protein
MATEINLEKRAANANFLYASLAGFIICSIFSDNPRILIYKFSSVADAASFQMRMALNTKPGAYTLKKSSFDAVFEQVDLL